MSSWTSTTDTLRTERARWQSTRKRVKNSLARKFASIIKRNNVCKTRCSMRWMCLFFFVSSPANELSKSCEITNSECNSSLVSFIRSVKCVCEIVRRKQHRICKRTEPNWKEHSYDTRYNVHLIIHSKWMVEI